MVELAIAGNHRFAVDRIELDRAGPSFTVDTLEALRATRYGEVVGDLFLLLSVEAFRAFPTWRSPARILELARLVVVPRDGYPDARAGVPRRPHRTR